MSKPSGRPLKYREAIEALDPNALYTPALVAAFGVERGLLPGLATANVKLSRQRCRIAMGRLTNNHFFPDEGDGMATIPGQSPTPGWFGWRCQETLN